MMLCNMLILQSVVSALTLTPSPSAAATPLLPSLSIDPGSISISGLSSGADFVVQLQVAHSVRDGCMHPSAYEFVTQDISNATWPLEHLNTWPCKAATHLKNAPLPSRPLQQALIKGVGVFAGQPYHCAVHHFGGPQDPLVSQCRGTRDDGKPTTVLSLSLSLLSRSFNFSEAVNLF